MNEFNEKEIKEEYLLKTLSEEDNDYWKDYNYGKTIEKLKIGREVEGSVGGKIKLINKTRSATLGATDWSVTGIGFKPKMVEIKASFFGGGYNEFSEGRATIDQIDGGLCKFVGYASLDYLSSTSRIIRMDLSSTSSQIAKLKSFDEDGFTLTFTTSTGTDTITMDITCFA